MKTIGPDGLTQSERFIKYAISVGAIEFVPQGRKLKSGRISPYFFNSGLFNTGDTIFELAKVYAGEILTRNIPAPQVIFGPAYKGIPLSVMTAYALGDVTGEKIGYSFDRKEEKTHGEGGVIVGASLEGTNVLIVDDVMTTGTSSGEAVKTVRAHGGNPVGCVIAFDRKERGSETSLSAVQEFEERYAVHTYSVATLNDLISYLEKFPPISGDDEFGELGEIRTKILAYREQYGVN